jgi:hypothetical protein
MLDRMELLGADYVDLIITEPKCIGFAVRIA